MTVYPVVLDLTDRACVVLGETNLAARKAQELVAAGARVTVVAGQPCSALTAAAAAGRITLHRRVPRSADLRGAWLAVDASGDPRLGRLAFAEAERSRVLLNVVDRPACCHFFAPAVVRRDPLVVAISTGGASPFVAAAVRQRLERMLGSEWGPFTGLVGRVRRRLRAAETPPAQQAAVYRRLLQSPVRALLRQGRLAEAEDAAARLTQPGPPAPGRVALVGAGPGSPELLTLAAQDCLADAGVVLHDALVHPDVLALCGPQARLVPVGRRGGKPGPEHADVIRLMIELARAGEDVVRLKGGDPFVFGRGGEELGALREAGVRVTVVAGVTAATAAPAAAGIALTRRGSAGSIAITTGHGGPAPARLEQLAAAADSLVVLMPLANLGAIARRLAGVLGPERPAAVIAAAGWPQQQVVRAPIAAIAAAVRRAGIAAPATLVVGHVAAEPSALPAAVRRRPPPAPRC
ncbi:MAG TPA: uroporphyrinogen-III C-methyltransferase [Verrucomicrobiae bacterium]|nr:uroporphyrinogen-III C-methyltransferase [Verrucomicrobiae bacterium]